MEKGESSCIDVKGNKQHLIYTMSIFQNICTVLIPFLLLLIHPSIILIQGYLMASLGVTAGAYLLNKNQWPSLLMLDWNLVLTRLQVSEYMTE